MLRAMCILTSSSRQYNSDLRDSYHSHTDDQLFLQEGQKPARPSDRRQQRRQQQQQSQASQAQGEGTDPGASGDAGKNLAHSSCCCMIKRNKSKDFCSNVESNGLQQPVLGRTQHVSAHDSAVC